MATTLGELSRRIVELQSRIAVVEGLIQYIATNYISGSGQVQVEMRFALESGGFVPESHVVVAMEELEARAFELRTELITLESTDFPDPEKPTAEVADPEAADPEAEPESGTPAEDPTPVVKTLRKKKPDVSRTGDPDSAHPTSRQGAA